MIREKYPNGTSVLLPFVNKKGKSVDITSVTGTFLVENHPFKIDTLLYIGNVESLKSYLKKKFNQSIDDVDVDFDKIDGVTIPCSREDGSQFILIFMPYFDWSVGKMSVLIHELLHACVFVMDMSGVHSNILGGEDEGMAHLMDQMTEMLLKKMVVKTHGKIHGRKKA